MDFLTFSCRWFADLPKLREEMEMQESLHVAVRFLIMQNDFHYDDEAIAALNVKRTSVRSMRSKTKERER